MPPDQASLGREEVDKRWNVYALGAIAYQLVVPPPNNLPRRDKTWKLVESTLATEDLSVRLNEYDTVLTKAAPLAEYDGAAAYLRKLIDGRAEPPADWPRHEHNRACIITVS